MSPAILLPVTLLALGQQPSPGELYQDLRGESGLRPGLKWMGSVHRYTSPDPAGLRVTVPAMRRDLAPVGLEASFPVEGDFEVVGTYELLSADRPTKGYGVGVDLFIEVGQERRRLAKVARYNTTGKGHIYQAQIADRDRPVDNVLKSTPTTERSGQLRMIRRGSTLTLSVKDATGEGFTDLLQGEIGTAEVTRLKFAVITGGATHAADARLVDFRIRSDSVKAEHIGGPAANGAGVAEVGEEPAPKVWSLAAGAVALVFTLALVGVGALAYARRRRRQEPAQAVSFPCPGCGKSIKAKAALAGKKARCPQCSEAVLVPASAAE